VRNEGAEAARIVLVDTPGFLEIVEYPDSGKIGAVARTPLSSLHFKENAAGYWDGEVAPPAETR
jgi:hypothetical protein